MPKFWAFPLEKPILIWYNYSVCFYDLHHIPTTLRAGDCEIMYWRYNRGILKPTFRVSLSPSVLRCVCIHTGNQGKKCDPALLFANILCLGRPCSGAPSGGHDVCVLPWRPSH